MPDARLLELSDVETGYGRSQVLFGISLSIAPCKRASMNSVTK